MFKASILTISDSCFNGKRDDQSGVFIKNFLEGKDEFHVIHYEILPDDKKIIAEKLRFLADSSRADIVITAGGTGLGPRDNTPEATLSVIDREVQGIAEFLRSESSRFTMNSWLSRACCGLRKKCLIINFPGSLNAVKECLELIFPLLPHAFSMITGEGHDQT
jgi:molybdenum cofactor synthesis domain-containing protein